ncbi:hypothetical protein [Sphingomonas sp.]|jgi:hypothetical protein|uniref:hypothetical protein n=1 Tax=Sphingomonas sp. TaxID=28214 RepID=UPI00257F43EA|nr:hypothetical protein [Sphingomonas sp.]
MPILFPLTLLGAAFLIYAIFAGATLALPIAAGLAAGFGSASIGLSTLPSILIGLIVFMAVIALGRFAALTLPSRTVRAMLILMFALPAAITGFSVASAFASLAGIASIGIALMVGALTGTVAAHRLGRPIG